MPGLVTPAYGTMDCAGTVLDLRQPQVMGILNVTPDSFSDGGLFVSVDAALEQARQMADAGAAVIDIGGESTRPGATPVSLETELERVLPVVQAVRRTLPGVIVSVDTSKPEVMSAAVAAGAGMINDVRALSAPGALDTAARLQVPVCLMHMQGEPVTMQTNPRYDDVTAEVRAFLETRLGVCQEAGITPDRILLDPGFGFGKTFEHNARLLRELSSLAAIGQPLLVGLSRKSMIGHILKAPAGERLYGSLALGVMAVCSGASLLRVHEVGPTVEAVRVAHGMLSA